MKKGPYGLTFARIRVPDIESSIDFYTYHAGLTLERRGDGYAQLRAAERCVSIELVVDTGREEAFTESICFDVESPEILEEIRGRVEAAGYPVRPLHERTAEICEGGFATVDPDGLVVELVLEFHEFAEAPSIELRPMDLVHPFLATPNYDASLTFYVDVLGFRVSDYIEQSTAFLRSEDRYHHSLAIRRDKTFYVAHFCFLMKSFDHVMRMRARAIYKGVPIASDLVNHSASHSLAFYMQDRAHGPRVELCDGHRTFTQEEHDVTHRPRRMRVDPRNIDVWRAAADDWGRF
jgi:catechol 2,3-dioxygenase-like lactoylglutathione lyase family enzyme